MVSIKRFNPGDRVMIKDSSEFIWEVKEYIDGKYNVNVDRIQLNNLSDNETLSGILTLERYENGIRIETEKHQDNLVPSG